MPFLIYGGDPAHATGSASGPVKAVEHRRTYVCPHCCSEFVRDVLLAEHLSVVHPIRHPHLRLGGHCSYEDSRLTLAPLCRTRNRYMSYERPRQRARSGSKRIAIGLEVYRRTMSRRRIPNKLHVWIEARKRHGLSNAQIQMARELGQDQNNTRHDDAE